MRTSRSNRTLELHDCIPQQEAQSPAVVAWFGNAGPSSHSLMELVNQDPVAVRDQVLAEWRKVIEILSAHILRERTIRFWMNPLIEMSPLKFENVDNLARIVVLRQLLRTGEYSAVTYSGKSRMVAEVVSALCDEVGLEFRLTTSRFRLRLRGHAVPRRFMAFIYLGHHLWSRWPLRCRSGQQFGRLTFVSYFAHLDWSELEHSRFKSHQWSELRDSLLMGEQVSWLHHYISTTGQVTPRSAHRLVRSLEDNSDSHRFVDSELNFGVAVRSVARCLLNVFRRTEVSTLDQELLRAGLASEWRVLRGTCVDGLVGVSFARNLLTDLLIERSVHRCPFGSSALLLWENQPWERSFIRHWHRIVRGKVASYAHTTVPFWCLPYFDWFLQDVSPHEFAEISADMYLVNGPLSQRTLQEAGQPAGRFTEVEAFRYLANPVVGPKLSTVDSSEILTILLAGEIRSEPTLQMLTSVVQGADALAKKPLIILKPHPASNVEIPAEYRSTVKIDLGTLGSLFPRVDVVIGSAGTSAVVEAVAAGIPCASYVAKNALNFSSLLGSEGHQFLSNPEDVGNFLESFDVATSLESSNLFFLDRDLDRWSQVLNSLGIDVASSH